jgi:hypothetical protein
MREDAPQLTRKSERGRKIKHTPEDLKRRIKDILIPKMKKIQRLFHATGMTHSTLYQYLKKCLIWYDNHAVKPHLTPAGIKK